MGVFFRAWKNLEIQWSKICPFKFSIHGLPGGTRVIIDSPHKITGPISNHKSLLSTLENPLAQTTEYDLFKLVS